MKLSKQLVSLELAKEMKELGFKQESLFFMDNKKITMSRDSCPYDENSISLYAVAELGEMLPFCLKNNGALLEMGKIDDRYYCAYIIVGKMIRWYEESNEADARAKLLIHLAENKLITPSEL